MSVIKKIKYCPFCGSKKIFIEESKLCCKECKCHVKLAQEVPTDIIIVPPLMIKRKGRDIIFTNRTNSRGRLKIRKNTKNRLSE